MLPTASVDGQEDVSLADLCVWVKTQGAGAAGNVLAARCSDSGHSAAEILLHMDHDTLLSTLQTEFNGEQKKALALILSGRKMLRREFRVSLKELPAAMDRAVYEMERFPMVLDPSSQVTRFLKYLLGAFLMVGNPPFNLRKHLVGALKHDTCLNWSLTTNSDGAGP